MEIPLYYYTHNNFQAAKLVNGIKDSLNTHDIVLQFILDAKQAFTKEA